MLQMLQFFRRVYTLIRRGRLESDLAAELEFHHALKQLEFEGAGLALGRCIIRSPGRAGATSPSHKEDAQCVALAVGRRRPLPMIVLIASFLPARPAARLDPAVRLRD